VLTCKFQEKFLSVFHFIPITCCKQLENNRQKEKEDKIERREGGEGRREKGREGREGGRRGGRGGKEGGRGIRERIVNLLDRKPMSGKR
jgi:hypothetical protein